MTFDIGFDISGRRARRPSILDKFPGANWAADFEASAYFASGMLRSLSEAMSDARSTEIIVPDADGILQAIASGQPARTSEGLHVYGAATNKCTNFCANPTDLTNISKSGDAASTLTVVDDATALMTAGLSNICSSGKVYKLDNSAGVTSALAIVDGETGSTGQHAVSAYMRGTGAARLSFSVTGGNAASALTSSYVRRTFTNSPLTATDKMRVVAEPGTVVFFVLNQLEEGGRATPPIVTAGTATPRAACVPAVAQGTGGTPFEGYDPAQADLTFTCEWEGVPALTGTHRGLVEIRLNASLTTDRTYLFIESSNQLKLGVADDVTWRSGPAFSVGAYDDGLRHRATCYLNRTTGDIKLSVDGSVPVTANKIGQMPSGFTSMTLGHGHAANHANGVVKSVTLASGDFFDAWRTAT
ncbi:MAG: hypothetical protein RLN89_04290 [Parvibaculum sp.]